MAKGRRRPPTGGAGGSTGPPGASRENGYYRIVDRPDGDWDYRPKNPDVDPPVGQSELARTTRQLYIWAVENVKDDNEYIDIRQRLRNVFFAGAVQEPIDKHARDLMEELRKELAVRADKIIGHQAAHAAKLHLGISGFFFLISCILWFIKNHPNFVNEIPGTALFNYALLITAAAASSAVPVGFRPDVSTLSQFDSETKRYERPILKAIEGLILVLCVAFFIQNEWITVAIGGKSLDISGNSIVALGLGSLLGLLNKRMAEITSPVVERFLRIGRGKQTPGDHTSTKGTASGARTHKPT